MSEYWRGKTVIVTGGSSGLGRTLAERWTRAGANVVIAARHQDKLDSVSSEIARSAGKAPLTVVADVTRADDAVALVAKAREQFGRIDALAHSAGVSDRGRVIETTPERFEELWRINFLAAVHCARAAANSLVESQGHLVLIGSLASKVAPRWLGGYPTSKFPLAAYAQQLRLEMSESGLHVLLVCPGPIARPAGETPRYSERTAGLPEEANKPGGGAKVSALDPVVLAEKILRACEKRKSELVVPGKSRILFTLSALYAPLGDWLLKKVT